MNTVPAPSSDSEESVRQLVADHLGSPVGSSVPFRLGSGRQVLRSGERIRPDTSQSDVDRAEREGV
jgi:hypothetical protein